MTDPTLDPRHTALLVMDYQNGILSSLDEMDALVQRAAKAIDVVREHGGRIGYVRVAFTDEEYDAIPAGAAMAAAATPDRRAALDEASPATAVHDAIAPQPGDLVVRKTRVGAFSTTDLHDQLQAHGVTTLVLAGVSTSGVVLSTLRDAADKDYRLVVLADACADRDPEVHATLVGRVFPRQATVVDVDDLSGLLG